MKCSVIVITLLFIATAFVAVERCPCLVMAEEITTEVASESTIVFTDSEAAASETTDASTADTTADDPTIQTTIGTPTSTSDDTAALETTTIEAQLTTTSEPESTASSVEDNETMLTIDVPATSHETSTDVTDGTDVPSEAPDGNITTAPSAEPHEHSVTSTRRRSISHTRNPIHSLSASGSSSSALSSTITLSASRTMTLTRTDSALPSTTETRSLSSDVTTTLSGTLTETETASMTSTTSLAKTVTDTLSWPLIPSSVVLVSPLSQVISGDSMWSANGGFHRTIVFQVLEGMLDPSSQQSLWECIEVSDDGGGIFVRDRFEYTSNFTTQELQIVLDHQPDYRFYDPRFFTIMFTEACIVGRVQPNQPSGGFRFMVTDTSMPLTVPVGLSNAANYIAGVTGLIGAFVTVSLGSAVTMGSTIRHVTECNGRVGERIPAYYHPLQFSIGSTRTRYWLGAVVMNSLVLLALFIAGYIVADCRSSRYDTTVIREAAAVRFPSFLAPLWLMTALPTTTGIAVIFQYGTAGERVGAGVLSVFMVAQCGLVALILLPWFGAEWEEFDDVASILPPEELDDDDDDDDAASLPLTQWFLGMGDWVDATLLSKHHRGYCCRFGLFFMCFRDGRQWFILFEWAFAIASGIAGSLYEKPATCRTASLTLLIVMLVYMAVVVLLKPFKSKFLKALANTRAVLQLVASLFGFLYHSGLGQWGEGISSSILVVLFLLIPIQLLLQLFLMGVHSKRQERMRKRIANSYINRPMREMKAASKLKRGGHVHRSLTKKEQASSLKDQFRDRARKYLGNHLVDDGNADEDESDGWEGAFVRTQGVGRASQQRGRVHPSLRVPEKALRSHPSGCDMGGETVGELRQARDGGACGSLRAPSDAQQLHWSGEPAAWPAQHPSASGLVGAPPPWSYMPPWSLAMPPPHTLFVQPPQAPIAPAHGIHPALGAMPHQHPPNSTPWWAAAPPAARGPWATPSDFVDQKGEENVSAYASFDAEFDRVMNKNKR